MQRHPGGAPPPPPPPPPQPGHGGVYAEAPRPKNDGIPYIGSRISLISKTDIRYEGFLFNIDTQQSMVALQHVRSFGTEGRRADAIPPSDQVLPYATFKASEIKDLHVSEAAPPPMYGYAQPPPPPPMPYHAHGVYAQPPLPPGPPAPQPPLPPSHPVQPPAPRQPPPPPSPPKKPASPPKARPAPAGPTLLTPGAFANAPKPAAPQPVVQQAPPSPRRVEEAAPVHQAPRSSNDRNASAGSRTIPGMGDHLLKRKERRVPGGADGSVSTGQDFNFEQNLSGFDKEVEFSKLEISDNKAKGSYQKSSFFDTISCDALDRLEGKQTRITSGQERKLNSETFGAVGLNNNRRNFRGGRSGGGGNGGRGGGRRGGGRGRGNTSWDGRPRDHN